VLYHLKWIPITQTKVIGKPYSSSLLAHNHGINLLHALKMFNETPTEEPWFYEKRVVFLNNKYYTVNEDDSVSMMFRNGFVCLHKLVCNIYEHSDEVLKSMYGEHFSELIHTFMKELYYHSKRTTDYNVDLLELEKAVKKKQRCSLESLLVRTYFEKDQIDVCSICIQKIVLCEKIIKTTCDHLFHSKCLIKWSEDHQACPCCRKDFYYQEMIKRNEKYCITPHLEL
jgi:hypothetical protein